MKISKLFSTIINHKFPPKCKHQCSSPLKTYQSEHKIYKSIREQTIKTEFKQKPWTKDATIDSTQIIWLNIKNLHHDFQQIQFFLIEKLLAPVELENLSVKLINYLANMPQHYIKQKQSKCPFVSPHQKGTELVNILIMTHEKSMVYSLNLVIKETLTEKPLHNSRSSILV